MPRLDKTGPRGQGPKTGRKMGKCSGESRIAWGCCGGRGRGFWGVFSPKNDLNALEAEEKMLEKELDVVRKEKNSLKNRKK